MWSDAIVVVPPALDEHLGFVECRELFAEKQLVAKLGLIS